MEQKYEIIGLAGRARSGKSTLAKALNETEGFIIMSFATPLKKLCCKLMDGIPLVKLNELKNNGDEIELVVDDTFVGTISSETNLPEECIWQILKDNGCHAIYGVRELLQVVGTDIIRKLYADWHVDKTMEAIEELPEGSKVVIDDVRFPNEKETIELRGGEVIFVLNPRELKTVSHHPSEELLMWYNFAQSHIIINYSNIHQFCADFLSMYKRGFTGIPRYMEEYQRYRNHIGYTTDNLWGLYHYDKEMFEKIVEAVRQGELERAWEYPTIYIGFRGFKDCDDLKACANFDGLTNEYYVTNPFIIENLKLYS